jgi:hypothetical protein
MKRIFNVSTSVLPMTLAAAWAITCAAKEPAHFVPANVSKAGNIPYPASSLDAGVVTLSVDLDKTGQVTGVGILRDISSVSGPAAAAQQHTRESRSNPTSLWRSCFDLHRHHFPEINSVFVSWAEATAAKSRKGNRKSTGVWYARRHHLW